jgi:predicted PurR-regulated permease PerM
MNDIPPAKKSAKDKGNSDAPAESLRPESHPQSFADAAKSLVRQPSVPLNALLVLAALYTLYFARDILIPIALAVMFDLLLSPLVAKLKRFRIPEALGAGLVMMVVLGGIGWGAYALSAPAAQWMHQAPASLAQVERKLRVFKQPVQEVNQATKEVEKLTNVAPPGTKAPTVTVRDHSLAATLLSGTKLVVAQVVVVVILLYFLLASGDIFMRRLVRALSTGGDKRRAVEIMRAVRHDVTVYLGTVTLINLGVGTFTAIAMSAIGMPNPALWGAVAFILNFIPYLGALTTTAILAVVGLLSFDDVSRGLLAPALFQVVTNIESNLVTPYLLGRRLTLNPALVFLALVMWGWMWGVPGALLAVPFLVMLKIFADHTESLQAISVLLGRRDPS